MQLENMEEQRQRGAQVQGKYKGGQRVTAYPHELPHSSVILPPLNQRQGRDA